MKKLLKITKLYYIQILHQNPLLLPKISHRILYHLYFCGSFTNQCNGSCILIRIYEHLFPFERCHQSTTFYYCTSDTQLHNTSYLYMSTQTRNGLSQSMLSTAIYIPVMYNCHIILMYVIYDGMVVFISCLIKKLNGRD